jgi:hypothetical protein
LNLSQDCISLVRRLSSSLSFAILLIHKLP